MALVNKWKTNMEIQIVYKYNSKETKISGNKGGI